MYVLINLVGFFVFLGICYLLSKNRRQIPWSTVGRLLALNVFLAIFLSMVPMGRDLVRMAADGVNQFVSIAFVGVGFALPNWVNVPQMNFITAALLPLLMIVPVFDILTYTGILPFVIKEM